MALHRVDISQDETTVGVFLASRVEGLPALLACGGVLHFTRGGERTEVSEEGYSVHRGDFVFVADQCPTGQAQTVTTRDFPSDFAFIMASDAFGTNARHYMNRRPVTTVAANQGSLHAIVQAVHAGAAITAPIRDLVIVSHASAGGFLFFKLFDSSAAGSVSFEDLKGYLLNASRPTITTRILRQGANVHIRGCNIGNATPFLEKIKRVFGNHVTVTAPKFLTEYGFFQEGSTTTRWESLAYAFTLRRAQQAASRQALITLFRQAHFADVHGTPIPDANWNTWVPQNIHANSSTTHACTNPVHANAPAMRDFKYFAPARRRIGPYDLELEEEPATDAEKRQILRDSLPRLESMQDSYEFPEYEWYGFESAEDLVDSIRWTFTWNDEEDGGLLRCVGSWHEYQVRVPITDTGNTLLVNIVDPQNPRQFLRQDLVETDTTFFGSA